VNSAKAFQHLEYCRLDRAASLLNCDVSDLIHWGAICAIDICLKFDALKCEISESHDSTEGNQVPFQYTPGRGQVVIKGYLASYWIKHSFGDDSEWCCSGFWGIPPAILLEMEEENKKTVSLDNYYSLCNRHNGIEVFAHAYITQDVTADDLWITGRELKRIDNHLSNGKPFRTIYNDPGIEEKSTRQNAVTTQRLPRETSKQSSMIKALLLCMPSLSKLTDNPHELLTKFEKLCAENNVICPVSDGKTVKDWLSRADVKTK